MNANSSTVIQRTLRRRRVLLVWLLAAATASLALAIVARRAPLWGVQVTADALLVGYLGVLLRLRNVAAEQEMASHGLGA